jgi:CheY-like chemotaxis protein
LSSHRNTAILLVEDDEVDVMNVRRAFQRNNFSNPLYVAQDGVDALELLRGSRRSELKVFPRIVLLDLNLPRMNGIEFLNEIRSDPALRQLVVVVLTTSDDERDVLSAYDLNVAGYVIKPVTFDRFVQAMETLGMYWNLNQLPEGSGLAV